VQITQRQINLSIFGLFLAGGLLITVQDLFAPGSPFLLDNMVTNLLMLTLLIAYWRGWELARYVMVLFVSITLVVLFDPLPAQPIPAAEVALGLVVPPGQPGSSAARP
jgi:hypothetical protein